MGFSRYNNYNAGLDSRRSRKDSFFAAMPISISHGCEASALRTANSRGV